MHESIQQWKQHGFDHHCYVCVGDRDTTREAIITCAEHLIPRNSLATSVYVWSNDRLLIDDARTIASRSRIKTEQGSTKVFIISCADSTPEAQNTLLKIIEEPTPHTVFFFVVPHERVLLPTILSRAIVVRAHTTHEREERSIVTTLQKKTIGERIAWADDIAKKISDEKLPRSYARETVVQMIHEVEVLIHTNPTFVPCLEQLLTIYDYLGDMSASTKILLEKAALSLSH